MDIANNWTIIAGVATIVSMIFYWSKQAYLDPIVNREQEIKKKVRDDAIRKLNESQSIIEEKGEEQFVDDVTLLNSGKTFEI